MPGDLPLVPRDEIAAWMSHDREWPAGSTPPEIKAWRQRHWQRIAEAASLDPGAWWSGATEAVKASSDEVLLSRLDWLPFTAVLVAGGEPLQRRAAEGARADPRVAAVVFWALEDQPTLPGQPWGQEAAVASLLGLDVVVATQIRLLTAVRSAPLGDRSVWHSIDFWPNLLGGRLGRIAPELGWDYVRRLIAAAPDDLLTLIGANDLEGFCWNAAAAYIERIEQEAARDPRFRAALGSVWPGGDTVPAETYARLRRAAGTDRHQATDSAR